MLDKEKLNLMNELIIDLHEMTDPSDICKIFLDKVSAFINYKAGVFGFSSSLKDQRVLNNIVIKSSYDKEFESEFAKGQIKYSQYDYLNWLLSSTESIDYKDSELINKDLRLNSLYYKEFLEKSDLIHACGLIITKNKKAIASMALYNDTKSKDFSDEDIFILNYFLPHLETAFETHYRQLLQQSSPSYILKKKFNLTEREIEIIRYILEGDTNNEIANKLYVQTNTVKKHIYNIYAKFRVSSRTQLFQFILTNNLLDYFIKN